jgi:hypothetical protein
MPRRLRSCAAQVVTSTPSDRFALVELQRHAAQHRYFAVAGMQVGDFEHDAVRIGAPAAAGVAAVGIIGLANAHARFPR